MISGNFLRFEHKGIWEIADTPEEVITCLEKKQDWIPIREELQKSNSPEFLYL